MNNLFNCLINLISVRIHFMLQHATIHINPSIQMSSSVKFYMRLENILMDHSSHAKHLLEFQSNNSS